MKYELQPFELICRTACRFGSGTSFLNALFPLSRPDELTETDVTSLLDSPLLRSNAIQICPPSIHPIIRLSRTTKISRTAFIIIHRRKSKTNRYFCVFDFTEFLWYLSANRFIPSKISCPGLGRLSPNFQYLPL